MADDAQSPNLLRSTLHAVARAGKAALSLAREGARRLGPMLAAFWRALKPILRTTLQVLLALLIVFEEWGWQPLANLLGRLARWRPWAALETGIARLPPYAALVVFALPTLLLLPLKFLALILIARGQVVQAGLLFVAAKVVATALVARLFLLTQPALMQMGWFARVYDTIMPWHDALVARVHNSRVWRVARIWKERVRRIVMRQWWQMRPTVRKLWAQVVLAGQAARVTVRHFARIARRRIAAYRAR